MRATGVFDELRGLGAHDHVCFAYDMAEDFRARAIEFLRDGLAQGLQVRYLGRGSEAELWEDLAEVLDLSAALRHGAVGVMSLESMGGADGVLDPAGQVLAFAAATAEARDAGFAGLRVAIEATPLVRSRRHVEAFTRYEHLIDRYMTTQPFSALCGYSRWELGAATVGELACMHPVCNQGATSFRVYAAIGADLALGGEIDLTVQTQFAHALQRAAIKTTRPELMIDGTALDFVDHRALLSLRDYALASGATAVLLTSSRLPNRLMQMFAMEGIRAERNGPPERHPRYPIRSSRPSIGSHPHSS
jgi:anti-anti-sigma regulatory factor